MDTGLEKLIRLQELDNAADVGRRQIADLPASSQGLETRLQVSVETVEAARQRLAENQTTRRAIEKDLAAIQTRLSKFKDQLMDVKTNKEYQAMQKEIATAEHEVRALEDRMLERMLEADELTAEIKRAEAHLKAEQAEVARGRQEIEETRTTLERELERLAEARRRLVAETEPTALALFDHVVRARKVAVVEARDGHCSFCHVRLRPQVYNDIRRNDSLIQCESCQRILYFAAARVN